MRFVKNVTTGETYRFVSFVQKSVSGVTYVDATTHAMVKDDKGCTYYFPINEVEFVEEKEQKEGDNMKTVVFEGYNISLGQPVTEEREYESHVTNKEIQDDYEQWVWELISDYFVWNEV